MQTEFDTDEFQFAYPDGIDENFWNIARNKIILNSIQTHSLNKILDIGSGRGVVTDFLHKNGIKITGVEKGNTSPINNSNIEILYNTDATNIPSATASKFETISLFDVIEHISDPVIFIKNIMAHFASVKFLIVTIPARNELWSNFDDHFGHFRRYDLDMIKKEIEDAQFEIIESKYFFHSLSYAIRLNNILSKKREIRFSPPKGFSKIIHKFLGNLFYFENFIFPKSFYGSSIICIAKRK